MRLSEKEKMEPALAASILYYNKEEFEKFLGFWEGIVSESEFIPSGSFYKFISYLEVLYSRSETDEMFSKERKIKFIELNLSLETQETTKQRMGVWIAKMLEEDDPSLFELSEDLLDKYSWLCFMEKIKKIDKANIPYSDKLMVQANRPLKTKESVFKKLSEKFEAEQNKLYPFNIDFIDEILQPMGSQFMIFAARPGGGKTSLLLRYGLNLAERDVKVLYVSLEMGESQIRSRIASAFSGMSIDKSDYVNQNKILSSQKFSKIDNNLDMIINDSHDADTILRRMEQSVKERGTEVILLDYLSLCKFSGMDEWASLRELTSRLKRFAIEHNVLVVSCSQASRSSENHGISLADLYGSSTIEADSDIVVGIEQNDQKRGFSSDKRNGKIKVLKNRDGLIGEFSVKIDYVGLNIEEEL